MPGLRRGRDRCGATCRDGHPCQAPTIPGGLVCRHHGGSAPQVLLAAGLLLRQMAHYTACREVEEAQGTPGEFDAVCRFSAAERGLREYQEKLNRIAELRALLAGQRAANGTAKRTR